MGARPGPGPAPGFTVHQAAAAHDTVVVVVVAVLAGGLLLFPSLALLFRLVLAGTLDSHAATMAATPSPSALLDASRAGIGARIAAGALLAAIGFLTLADSGWAHAIGVIGLGVFAVAAFITSTPAEAAARHDATLDP